MTECTVITTIEISIQKNKGPWELVVTVEVDSRSEAVRLKSYLKNLKNSHKAIEYMMWLKKSAE